MGRNKEVEKFRRAFPYYDDDDIWDLYCRFGTLEDYREYQEEAREDEGMMESVMWDMSGGDEEMFEQNMEGSYDD